MTGFRQRAAEEMRSSAPAETLTPIMRKLVADSAVMLGRGPADASRRAAAARADAVSRLPELHRELRDRLRDHGVGYHLAATREEAVGLVVTLLGEARTVAKSKSMVAEEVGLTHALRARGIDVLETDIGEYIVDIEGRGPSHITAPAIHLNRARIREMLARAGADLSDDDPARLSRYVRDVVAGFFADCDAGITGANAVIASSGRIVITENEGNVALGASHPKLHIVITGYEKLVADEAGALAILEVLAPSATAQPLTAFTHFLAGPDRGQERHIVFVDNGRARIAADERYRDVLRCIRCGACMNACPVYRTAGGLSYGSPYMGPIGAVLSPLLSTDGEHADLPFASSLCGRCTEVCPVGIPLHRMLLDLRADAVAAGHAGSRKERLGWSLWARTMISASRARAATTVGRQALRLGGRFLRRRTNPSDPRRLPSTAPTRDPSMLIPLEAVKLPPVEVIAPGESPEDPVDLFRLRAEANGVRLLKLHRKKPGDLALEAAGAIASTGSVILTGKSAARRKLLNAGRLVVRVDASTIVRFPSDAVHLLGQSDALILTGASRTADIEKQIVRGIHGAEELVVIVDGAHART